MPRGTGRIVGAAILVSTIAFVGAYCSDRPAFQPANRHDVTLVYVGAEDCAPCRSWQRGAGAAFHASPEFPRVSYREVKSPTVLNLLKDEYWPDDLRKYRNRLDRRAGVPLWFVVADHEIVEQSFGERQWVDAVLPKLKSLLR